MKRVLTEVDDEFDKIYAMKDIYEEVSDIAFDISMIASSPSADTLGAANHSGEVRNAKELALKWEQEGKHLYDIKAMLVNELTTKLLDAIDDMNSMVKQLGGKAMKRVINSSSDKFWSTDVYSIEDIRKEIEKAVDAGTTLDDVDDYLNVLVDIGVIDDESFSELINWAAMLIDDKPVTASDEGAVVTVYQNNRNPNKYLEVKKASDGHTFVRQFMEWETDKGTVKNYNGSKSRRGRYHRTTLSTLSQMLEDYTEVQE